MQQVLGGEYHQYKKWHKRSFAQIKFLLLLSPTVIWIPVPTNCSFQRKLFRSGACGEAAAGDSDSPRLLFFRDRKTWMLKYRTEPVTNMLVTVFQKFDSINASVTHHFVLKFVNSVKPRGNRKNTGAAVMIITTTVANISFLIMTRTCLPRIRILQVHKYNS